MSESFRLHLGKWFDLNISTPSIKKCVRHIKYMIRLMKEKDQDVHESRCVALH